VNRFRDFVEVGLEASPFLRHSNVALKDRILLAGFADEASPKSVLMGEDVPVIRT
jgi:hypothetical protein